MKKLFILIVAVIVLTGCQRTQWVRPNTTAQQFNADKYQCEIEALRMYPNTAGQPIGNPSYSTNCTGYGNTLNCTSQQNQQMRSWIDTNAVSRAIMEERCLQARGYYKQAVQSPAQGKMLIMDNVRSTPTVSSDCNSPNATYFAKLQCKKAKATKWQTLNNDQVKCKTPDGLVFVTHINLCEEEFNGSVVE